MAKIKHKIFQIPINKSIGKVTEKYDTGVLKEINDFLSEGNKIYVNHSTTTISQNLLKSWGKDAIENEEVHNVAAYQNPQHKQNFSYYRHVNVDKYIVVSLVYRELEDDEIEEGIYKGQPMKLPNTKKSYEKPEVASEADKYIKEKEKK